MFSKENNVIIIKTHYILSDDGDDKGPHMGCEITEGKAPSAKGGGEQFRGVNKQELQWE